LQIEDLRLQIPVLHVPKSFKSLLSVTRELALCLCDARKGLSQAGGTFLLLFPYFGLTAAFSRQGAQTAPEKEHT